VLSSSIVNIEHSPPRLYFRDYISGVTLLTLILSETLFGAFHCCKNYILGCGPVLGAVNFLSIPGVGGQYLISNFVFIGKAIFFLFFIEFIT
jgi:hypothetical protein